MEEWEACLVQEWWVAEVVDQAQMHYRDLWTKILEQLNNSQDQVLADQEELVENKWACQVARINQLINKTKAQEEEVEVALQDQEVWDKNHLDHLVQVCQAWIIWVTWVAEWAVEVAWEWQLEEKLKTSQIGQTNLLRTLCSLNDLTYRLK